MIDKFLVSYSPAPQLSARWFEECARSLGGSRACAVMSRHHVLNPDDVGLLWHGLLPNTQQPPNMPMCHGVVCESLNRDILSIILCAPIYEVGAFHYDKYHHYSPDGITFLPINGRFKPFMIELKTPSRRPFGGNRPIPMQYIDQIQYSFLLDDRLFGAIYQELYCIPSNHTPSERMGTELLGSAIIFAHHAMHTKEKNINYGNASYYKPEIWQALSLQGKWSIVFTPRGAEYIQNARIAIFGALGIEWAPGNFLPPPEDLQETRPITGFISVCIYGHNIKNFFPDPEWAAQYVAKLYKLYDKYMPIIEDPADKERAPCINKQY